MKNLIFSLLLLPILVFAHSESNNIIVDTDMGIDDIRAVTYFSKMYNYNILGYVASEGVQSANKGAYNLRKILSTLEDNTPVYQGIISKVTPSKFREFVYKLNWNDLKDVDNANTSLSKLADQLNNSNDRITYVALGPLSNLQYLLKNVPSLKDRIDAVYFSGGLPKYYDKETYNYKQDSLAAEYVLSQKIPFYAFVSKDVDLPVFDNQTWNKIIDADNIHMYIFEKLFSDKKVMKHMFLDKGIYNAYDDMIPVFMQNPDLAKFDKINDNLFVMRKWDKIASNNIYYLHMKQKYEKNLVPRGNVSFFEFPINPSMYKEDIRRHIDLLIELYGLEEFKTIVITNELHRHLGSYSIIGAKMGIRAREILGAGLDDVIMISKAGSKPPISCLNDGLQVATGASSGRGNIRVEDDDDVEAEFFYNNKKVTLKLKKEVLNKIEKQIEDAKKENEVNSLGYYEFVRRASINNWMDLDRKKIFDEKIEEAKPPRN